MANGKNALITDPGDVRSHVFLLGAGASKATLDPFGGVDANGKTMPLLRELYKILGLGNLRLHKLVHVMNCQEFLICPA